MTGDFFGCSRRWRTSAERMTLSRCVGRWVNDSPTGFNCGNHNVTDSSQADEAIDRKAWT